ncbi:hypothetical protein [Butyrivibrio sp. FCS006]|uniref:hypothetical protein n=1 Tax=Butyrivibrio sp. FCS006 TaxID=1280684 RepID=UPI00040BF32D|nr:hypothetical protein [Butyrivibrio sp. FCS006]
MCDRSLTWYTGIRVNDKELWVSDYKYNALFRIDKMSKEVVFVGEFPVGSDNPKELHYESFCAGTTLYFLPQHSDCISLYDMQKNEFSSIAIGDRKHGYATIVGAYNFNDEVYWLVPRYTDMPILALSVKKNAIIEEISLNDLSDGEQGKVYEILYSCKTDSGIAFAINGTNTIVLFDSFLRTISIHKLDGIKSITGAITFYRNKLWISTDEGVSIWDIKGKNYIQLDKIQLPSHNVIEWMGVNNDTLICVPRWRDNILMYNINNYDISQISLNELELHSAIDERWDWRDFKMVYLENNFLELFPLKYKEKIRIDLLTRTLQVETYSYPKGYNPFGNRITQENIITTVSDFVGFLVE